MGLSGQVVQVVTIGAIIPETIDLVQLQLSSVHGIIGTIDQQTKGHRVETEQRPGHDGPVADFAYNIK